MSEGLREAMWMKWGQDEKDGKLKAADAIWGVSPGYDLIPEIDLPLNHSYFFDGTHSCPPLSPLGLQLYWARGCTHGLKYVNSYFNLPTCYGWQGRAKDGGIYWSFLIETDEQKIKQREVKFKTALQPFIDDFAGIWEKNKEELFEIYGKLRKFNPVTATNIDFMHFHWDLERACLRQWEIHFLGMQSSYSAWILLEKECKERFGIDDKSAEFQDMLRGFDNEIYKVDRELWVLAREAVEMGLADVFKAKTQQEITPALRQSSMGKLWLREFDRFIEVRGWRATNPFDMVAPTWLEAPDVPLKKVKDYIESGEADRQEYTLDVKRRELSEKREEAVKKMLDRVQPVEKASFKSLINLAQQASSYSEEHDLYCEMTMMAILRWGYLAIGKWLCDQGCIDRPDDVFMMNTAEIESSIMVPGKADMRWLTRKRRADWEALTDRFVKEGEFRAPIYTDRADLMEAVGKDLIPSFDPIAIKIVVGDMPTVTAEEIGADIVGICGCPGIAEGTAKVIMDCKDLGQLNAGDILVCPGTSPEWTIAFGLAAAVVGDRGGTLSHTAIIGREYGLPTIVNTFVACEKIKSGQRIRVDAGKGAIYILDKDK
jgi:pyruvate, water dikinase